MQNCRVDATKQNGIVEKSLFVRIISGKPVGKSWSP